ncbi:hypothetical protein PN36_02945 [Candidatus Thiomargarita nelsonii]|uniref:HTH cro/C1-type domain-containing protein n=1 Tax=Candidatus Thiomargarita nelsonii TaxID=1003181 RepID=A0A4E0QXB0_9GAMM|nr:hypothetical protein PN36_02945 [Candidatus Thiomargarita nelsonii]
MPTFAELLTKYMRRIRASGNDVAQEIGRSRETVLKWMHGNSKPAQKSCPRLQDCANFLRLTEQETNLFLKVAGCAQAYMDLPQTLFREYIQGLFARLSRKNPPVMLLLTQAGWGEPPLRDALLVQAKRQYSPENVLHIQPPYSAKLNEYFSDLGEQCGFDGVEDDSDFESALKKRLDDNPNPLFLLVSRFEQGVPSLRENLAGLLRSLSDESRYCQRLHIILCGGEELEKLKYEKGDLSLLNHATVEHWPEFGRDEVYALRDDRFKGLLLDDALVDDLLMISGGHPQLFNECLTLQQQQPHLPLKDYPEILSQSAQAPFIPLDKSAKQQLSEYLQQQDLGKFTQPIYSNLLRQLYWKNALVVRGENWKKRLFWRCDAFVMAGNKILMPVGENDEI